MKKTFLLILSICGLASAQTPLATDPATASSGNQFFDAVNSIAIDTNSLFFASAKLDFRSGAIQKADGTFADLGGDYNLSARWQAGGDIVLGTGNNTVSTIAADIAYRIPIHNLELDPQIGAGYNWDTQDAEGAVALRLSYVISPARRMFTFVQPSLDFSLTKLQRPVPRLLAGVGISF